MPQIQNTTESLREARADLNRGTAISPLGSKTLRFALVLAALFSIAIAPAAAQDPNLLATRGVYPNGSYTFDKLESINNLNGSLSYTIPLTSMPLGRAGMTVPVTLTYNSTLMDTYAVNGQDSSGTKHTYSWAQTSVWGGWQIGGFTYRLYESFPPTQPCGNGASAPYTLSIVMPDGAHHDLMPYGQPQALSGTASWYDPADGEDGCNGGKLTGPINYYYTIDGTYIKVGINQTNQQWTAYLPDGTTVNGTGWPANSNVQGWATGLASEIIDRNGNKVSISVNQSANTVVLTDDLQRTLTITGLTSPTSVTQTGFGGGTLTWTIGGYSYFTVTPTCTTTEYPYACGSYSGGGPAYLQVPSDTGTLRYSFQYKAPDGSMSQVTLPSGASTTYTLTATGALANSTSTAFPLYGVTAKQVNWVDNSDGNATARSESWSFTPSSISGTCYCSKVIKPDYGTETVYFSAPGGPLNNTVVKQTEPDGSTAEYLYNLNTPYNVTSNQPQNPYQQLVVRSVATNGSPALAAVERRTIDQNGNLVNDVSYDWISYASLTHNSSGYLTGFSPGTAIKTVATTYTVATPKASNGSSVSDNSSAYWNPGSPVLRSLPSTVTVSGVGPGSFATYTNYDSHGNAGTESRWDSTKAATVPSALSASNASVTQRTFDSYGNLLTQTDANGVETVYTYDSQSLHPTQVKVASGTPVARTSTYGWLDPYLGLLTSETDADNGITTAYGYDLQGRQTQVVEASNSLAHQTNTTYNDAGLQVIVQRDQSTSGDGALMTVTTYDQLYRPTLAQEMESPTSVSSITASGGNALGIKTQTRYLYSGNNSYRLVSNPFRAATSSAALGEQTMGWSLTTLDQNGRAVASQSFNGSGLPAAFGGGNASTSGTATTSYSANVTTATDQAGNARISYIDGAGRLTAVTEAPVAGSGTTALNYNTIYAYDVLNNLICANQNVSAVAGATCSGTAAPSSRPRIFSYDSLARLQSTSNPENGTVSYSYDANGNLKTKTDYRGVVTNYSVDALNRVYSKTYNDVASPVAATAPVTYIYATAGNQSGSYSVGQLVSAASADSTTTYGNFDALGRAQTSSQTTAGQTYNFSYTYNISGLTSETYPTGRTVNVTHDGANRELGVSGTLSSTTTNYAGNVAYAAHGAPVSYQYVGVTNGTGRMMRNNTFNARLQLSGYSESNSSYIIPYVSATLNWVDANGHDNGNLQTANYVHNVTGTPSTLTFNEGFTYDAANRLSTATDTSPSGSSNTTNWSRNFGYDTYGNMWVTANSGVALMGNTPTGSTTSSTAFTANNQINASSYDAAGNQTTVNGNTQTYDAENRQVAVSFAGASEIYLYDGDGQRVAKASSGGPTTVFVHDAMGRLAVEYSTIPNGSPCTTCYISADHLGTARLVVDQNGNVIARHDYLPFGEEIPVSTVGRNGQWGTGNDTINQKFTGKERDQESGLDYFGARYYGSALGRFTSPDPINLTNARIRNPANTLNKYVYGGNNPLKYVDRDGKDITIFYEPEDYGHIFLAVVNPDNGRYAFLSYGPENGDMNLFTKTPGQFNFPVDFRNSSSLTIQTNPEDSNTLINAITAINNGQAPDFSLFTNNCTTEVQDVLKDLGLNFGDILPSTYWDDLYHKHSEDVKENPFNLLFTAPHQAGKDYGNPRIPGADWTSLLRRLWQLQLRNAQGEQSINEPKACVSAGGETTCDK